MYNDSVEQIVIPDGITFIGNNAFSGCKSLKEVVIPDSVTQIEEMAFLDCNKKVTIKAEKDTYAYHYAMEKNLSWKEK